MRHSSKNLSTVTWKSVRIRWHEMWTIKSALRWERNCFQGNTCAEIEHHRCFVLTTIISRNERLLYVFSTKWCVATCLNTSQKPLKGVKNGHKRLIIILINPCQKHFLLAHQEDVTETTVYRASSWRSVDSPASVNFVKIFELYELAKSSKWVRISLLCRMALLASVSPSLTIKYMRTVNIENSQEEFVIEILSKEVVYTRTLPNI